MSRILWDHGLCVSTYAGPVRETPELPRKRVQLTNLEDVLTLSMEQWRDLCDAVQLLGPDCEGEEL